MFGSEKQPRLNRSNWSGQSMHVVLFKNKQFLFKVSIGHKKWIQYSRTRYSYICAALLEILILHVHIKKEGWGGGGGGGRGESPLLLLPPLFPSICHRSLLERSHTHCSIQGGTDTPPSCGDYYVQYVQCALECSDFCVFMKMWRVSWAFVCKIKIENLPWHVCNFFCHFYLI